ncbi:rubrerythrin-like domain-containing protein [Halolamina sp.]
MNPVYRVSAESNPASCPECESPMHNISVPHE